MHPHAFSSTRSRSAEPAQTTPLKNFRSRAAPPEWTAYVLRRGMEPSSLVGGSLDPLGVPLLTSGADTQPFQDTQQARRGAHAQHARSRCSAGSLYSWSAICPEATTTMQKTTRRRCAAGTRNFVSVGSSMSPVRS